MAISGLLFVSDVPKSSSFQSADTKLRNTREIVPQPTKATLSKCPGLKKIGLSGVDTELINAEILGNEWSSFGDRKRWLFHGSNERLREWFNSTKDIDWKPRDDAYEDGKYHYYQ